MDVGYKRKISVKMTPRLFPLASARTEFLFIGMGRTLSIRLECRFGYVGFEGCTSHSGEEVE